MEYKDRINDKRQDLQSQRSRLQGQVLSDKSRSRMKRRRNTKIDRNVAHATNKKFCAPAHVQ